MRTILLQRSIQLHLSSFCTSSCSEKGEKAKREREEEKGEKKKRDINMDSFEATREEVVPAIIYCSHVTEYSQTSYYLLLDFLKSKKMSERQKRGGE